MKYIYSIMLVIIIISFSLKAQNMSVFLKATQSDWYPEFLNPVVKTITNYTAGTKILDVGTGPGTLPQMLIESDSRLLITGIDIDNNMIETARKRFQHANVSFQYQRINAPLDFEASYFDIVTFCSVLFLVNDSIKTNLMNEALRVLNSSGKIIILTPKGGKSIISAFTEVRQYKSSFKNFTFLIWKMATTRSARKWQSEKWAKNFATENKLHYTISTVFNNNATIEMLTKI